MGQDFVKERIKHFDEEQKKEEKARKPYKKDQKDKELITNANILWSQPEIALFWDGITLGKKLNKI